MPWCHHVVILPRICGEEEGVWRAMNGEGCERGRGARQRGKERGRRIRQVESLRLAFAARELLLPPIDDDAARSHRRDADRTLRLATQLFESTLVILEKILVRMEAPAVVLVQPLLLLLVSMCSSTMRVYISTHVSHSEPYRLSSGSVCLVCTLHTTRTNSM
jgi:hypothetical protein